ncbi:MAG: hypothetical protein CMB16_00540 [Euryarchaeota archaeon]|nr:hypothetical protein [Euryarchaeota archaeon]
MQIEIPYTPRPLQAELHEALDKHRWAVVVCHRRFGKTVMAINHLLRHAVLCEKPNPRVSYIAPTFTQAKRIAFDYLKVFAEKIPMVRFHETELRCDLPNGGRIQLLGAENPSSLRGIYLDYCVLDESADMPESLFPEVIRPALADRKGGALFIGTPRGQNSFYDLYESAKATEGWYTKTFKASETKILDDEELNASKSMMTKDQYDQEFECSWVANVAGSIYGKYLATAMEEGRITKVPYERGAKVDTFWDLGIGDSTAIIFAQKIGRAIHIIDYFEARGEGLDFYAKILQNKSYLYDSHYAPHDIDVRELGTGKSRREIAWELGINFRVVPKLPIEDGIHAGQITLSRCWFDKENTKPLLECLRQYHRAYNERLRSFHKKPVHDWSSHGADAFRYLATGIRETKTWQEKAPQRIAESTYDPFNQQGEKEIGVVL